MELGANAVPLLVTLPLTPDPDDCCAAETAQRRAVVVDKLSRFCLIVFLWFILQVLMKAALPEAAHGAGLETQLETEVWAPGPMCFTQASRTRLSV